MATAKRLIKKAPTIIQRAYYNMVPFGKRYGEEYIKTTQLLKQTLEYTPDMLKAYQFYQLRRVMSNAYDNVPYYHKLMVDYGVKRVIDDPSDISKLPVLTKQLVLDNWNDLINKRYQGKPVLFKTSGSTGKKFQFLGDDNLYKREAAFVNRAFELHGAKLYDNRTVWVRRYAPKAGDPLSYTDNDLSMFKLADEAYAPSNAKPYIKDAATSVIGHHDEDGIARFLRERFSL